MRDSQYPFMVLIPIDDCWEIKISVISYYRNKMNSDLSRYYGRWYEVARTANPFERDCVASMADYIPSVYNSDGPFTVVNTCFRKDGTWYQTIGQVEKSSSGQLVVKFNYELGPKGSRAIDTPPGQYNILWTDYDNYSIVGGGPFSWILSRTPQLTEAKMDFLLRKASELGININQLR